MGYWTRQKLSWAHCLQWTRGKLWPLHDQLICQANLHNFLWKVEMEKNLESLMINVVEMKILQRFQLEYDHCSYFGFYEQPTIHIFAASNKNTSYITRNSKHLKFANWKLLNLHFQKNRLSCPHLLILIPVRSQDS